MVRISILVVLGLYLARRPVLAAVVTQELRIVNTNLAPDGFARDTVVANDGFPGPLIQGNMGDNFQLNVIDQLTNPNMRRATSIHWHGFFQAHTNEMDGPSFVNQCPIIPGDSFLYNFSTPGQAGTFWYHSHLSTQYCDGLRGAFVVYDPNDPQLSLYDVDDASTVITLADWYHQLSTVLFPNNNKDAPNADSTLINGLGRFKGGSASPLAVVRARPGLRHRFRLVSTSCFPSFTFSIDGHSMTIIEADGQATEPLTVDSLDIYVAQRYSIIVTANQPVGNYWIRANPSSGNKGFSGGINSAILRYDGAPDEEPTSQPLNGGVKFDETNLHALIDPTPPGLPFPGGVDVAINMVIDRDSQTKDFTINGFPFIPPTVPVLLQIISGAVSPGSIMPAGSIYSLPPNKSIEISVPGGPGGFHHPFHLHGHAFSVVRSAGSNKFNFVNPVKRDVVQVGTGGDNVTFRFFTDNPGPWFLHCHIDWHLEAGLAIVFAEDAPDAAAFNPPNDAWLNLCPRYDANNPDSHLA